MNSMKTLRVSKATLMAGVLSLGLLNASRNAQATIVVGPGFQESGYTVVYELPIVPGANYSGSVPYTTDNSGTIVPGSFSRIGYYLELQSGAGPIQYVSV